MIDARPDAVVSIAVDGSAAKAGARVIKRDLNEIDGAAMTAKRGVAALTAALGGLTAGLTLDRALREFSLFEQGIKNVATVSGATALELQALDEAALRAAASTRFNPSQTTAALYSLASSGQAAAEQIATLPNVLNLAEAAQADLGTTTELLTATLNQFGLQASDSTRVADVFTASIGASALNVNRLQVAFRNAGPTAAAYGQSLEGTTAAVGILTSAFGNGERAGTGFRAALAELPDQAEALGVQVFDASGRMRPFVDILESIEERSISASALVRTFGAEAGPALAALLSKGSEALRQMEERITSSGQAATTAAAQLDTLKGDYDGLASAIDVAMVEIGRSQSGLARDSIQTVTNLIRLWSGYGDTLGEVRADTERLAAAIETVGFAALAVAIGRGTQVLGGYATAQLAAASAAARLNAENAAGAALYASLTKAQLSETAATVGSTKATLAAVAAARADAVSQLQRAASAVESAQATIRATQATGSAALASGLLRRAENELTVAMRARSVAMGELALLGQQQARLEASLAAATSAHSAAALRSGAATQGAAKAMAAASVSGRLMAGSINAARGALALIGGPLGAAVIAGVGIAYLVMRENEAERQTRKLREEIKKLEGGLNDLDDTSTRIRLDGVRNEIKEASDQIANLELQMSDAGRGVGGSGVGIDSQFLGTAGAVDDLREKFDGLINQRRELLILEGTLSGKILESEAAMRGTGEATDELAEKTTDLNAVAQKRLDLLLQGVSVSRAELLAKLEVENATAQQIEKQLELLALTERIQEVEGRRKVNEDAARQNDILEKQFSLMRDGVDANEALTRAQMDAAGVMSGRIDLFISLTRQIEDYTRAQEEMRQQEAAIFQNNLDTDSTVNGLRQQITLQQQILDLRLKGHSAEDAAFQVELDRVRARIAYFDLHEMHDEQRIESMREQALLLDQQGAALSRWEQFMNTDSFVSGAAEIRDALGSIGDPLIGLIDGFSKLEKVARSSADAIKDANEGPAEGRALRVQQAELKTMQEKIGVYGDLAGAAANFFSEGTSGYKLMEGASKAFYAIELTMAAASLAEKLGLISAETAAVVGSAGIKATAEGIAAVASSMVGLPFPANIAAMGATIAALVGLGVAITGGGGGGAGGYVPSAASQGRGTILGNSDAESESITGSLELLTDLADDQLDISRSQLRALQAIERGTQETATALARGLADTTVQGVQRIDIAAGQTLGGVASGGLSANFARDLVPFEDFFNRDRVVREDLDARLSRSIGDLFDGLVESVVESAGAIGIAGTNLRGRLEALELSLDTIDVQGLEGDEIIERISAVFSAAGDAAVMAVLPFLDDYQQVNEGLLETLTRLSAQTQIAEGAFGDLGISLANAPNPYAIVDGWIIEGLVPITRVVSQAEIMMATFDQLASSAGGVEQFAENVGSLLDAVLTEEQQFERLQRQLSEGLASVNLELPASAEGLAELVSGLNIFTAAGQEQFTVVSQLAEGLEDYFDTLADRERERQGFLDSIRDRTEELTLSAEELAAVRLDRQIAEWRAEAERLGLEQSVIDPLIALERAALNAGGSVESLVEEMEAFNARFATQLARQGLSGQEMELFDSNQRYQQELAEAERLGADITQVETFFANERLSIIQKYSDQALAAAEAAEGRRVDFITGVERQIAGFGLEGLELELFNVAAQMNALREQAAAAGADTALVDQLEALKIGAAEAAEALRQQEAAQDLLNRQNDFLGGIQSRIDEFGIDSELQRIERDMQALREQASALDLETTLIDQLRDLEVGAIEAAEALRLQAEENERLVAIADFDRGIGDRIARMGLSGQALDIFNLDREFEGLRDQAEELGGNLLAVETAYWLEREAIASSYLEQSNENLRRAYETQASEIQRTVESWMESADRLREFRQDLLTGDAARLSPLDQYQAQAELFDQTSRLARLGDMDAQQRLEGVGRSFLDASQTVNASGTAYFRDLERVLSEVDAAIGSAEFEASMAQQQLDATQNSLTQLIDLNASNNSIEEALKQLKEATERAAELTLQANGEQTAHANKVNATGFTELVAAIQAVQAEVAEIRAKIDLADAGA